MAYVFDFDHAHRRPPMEMKDLLGGKGANLAEMTSVLHLPVPPGFTISTDACRAHMESGWPKGLTEEAGQGTLPAGAIDGQGDRRPVGPAAGLGALGGQVLHARDDGHRLEPRVSTTSRSRAWPSRPATSGSPTTPTAGSSPCTGGSCSTSPAQEFDSLFEAAKELAGTTSDARVPTELLRYLVESYQQVVERHTGQPFPQDPAAQLRGAIEAVFRSWNGPRAIAYRERERIPHTLGTAVNVQAMVFGNRDDQSGTGVGFTRDPATGRPAAPTATSWSTPRARTWWPASATPSRCRPSSPSFPKVHTRAARRSSTGSSATTATCATPSSPSSRASSGCSRPGWASAPDGPPSRWPST